MSWQASAWAKGQRLGSPAAKSILLCLADYAEPEKARCWPSQAQLAADAEVSERTAREWLQRLEDWGLIERERRAKPNGARAADMIVLRLGVTVRDGAERCREMKAEDEESAACEVAGEVADGESLPANSAGRTYRQPDAEPTGNQPQPTGNQFRASIEEPPIEPSKGTSQPGAREGATARVERGAEREGGREGEDPKKIEADGWALLKNWPQFDGMPKEPAMAIWRTLPAEERASARRRFLPWLELLRKQRKAHIPAPSTYLKEKLWLAVADPADAPPPPLVAAPFGKLWMALRLAHLLAGAGPLPRPSGFIASLIEQGGEAGERERLAHQARFGWPAVKRMDELAAHRTGWTVRPDDPQVDGMIEGFAGVRRSDPAFGAWQALHERRGWPWLPDPGGHEWFYFPAGGPDGLDAFETAVKGEGGRGEDNGGGQEAAE